MGVFDKKLIALLVVVVAALIGLVYTIEQTARPASERAGTVASGESEGEHAGHAH
jgi:hypothetical protein